ncbi:MAG TPA: BamA/TamA family outer membrane protein [Bacteroidota bacterium]|nr:BamA/TamA family outer membrane protein [Bacteroidota bacterium]
MKRFVVMLFFLVSANPVTSQAFQYSRDGRTAVTLAPDTQYRAGWLHEIFFGAHWRDLWATPMEVTVLDLDEFAGGLTPVKRGGGLQTKSLHFRGADGKKYKFRSMTKDPKKVLPPELQESVAADIVQDQISSSNPMAPVIVPPLLIAAGVLNAPPQIVFLPNASELGKFQPEFGGLLGTIEENPDDPDDENSDAARFGGAGKFHDSFKFFEALEEDSDERVDEAEYIKARLMDIFLGDWDRHILQWRWAGYRTGLPGGSGGNSATGPPEGADSGKAGGRRWVPIPRDRDQAFARFDGLFPWIASIAVPQLEGFGDDLPEIEDLTWSGRFVDRRLLSGAAWSVWDSVAGYLQKRLTDDVIEEAVRLLPGEMFALEGDYLIRTLIIRRTALPAAAREFYELLAEYPDIRATDKREYVEAAYLDGGRVDVAIYKRDKESGGKRGGAFFRRVFLDHETHEIRIYLNGGDDLVRVTGKRSASTGIVVVGGKGDDEIIDESTGGGIAESVPFTLFSAPAVTVYDENPETRRSTLTRMGFDATPARKPLTEQEKYEPPVRDYGYDWKFAPWYGVSPDEGLFIGGGPILYKHGFRMDPYVYRMQLRGGYAATPERIRLDYSGDFYSLVPGRRVNLLAEFSQLDILNYFGAGNSTPLDDSLLDAGHYKARSRHLLLAPTLVFPLSEATQFSLGVGLKQFDPDPAAGTILGTLAPYRSTEDSWYGSLQFEARYDSRDLPAAATGGILSIIRFSAHHPLTRGFESFQKLAGEFRTYYTPADSLLTFAIRGGAQKNWGTFPWYESAFLGGTGSGLNGSIAGGAGGTGGAMAPLRGFEKQRFAGGSAVYGGAEMRMGLASFMFLVPMKFGITLSGETGRVFAENESSEQWHSAIGGGIWFSFIDPMNVLGLSVVGSQERTGVYVAGGFAF